MANTHALEHERGLRRFEVYEAKCENAVITHDTFDSTKELKFHLTKGAANKIQKRNRQNRGAGELLFPRPRGVDDQNLFQVYVFASDVFDARQSLHRTPAQRAPQKDLALPDTSGEI